MPFSRRKEQVRHKERKAKGERRGGRGDPFAHLSEEREQAEGDEPWFLAPDDGPELDVEAGISSNLDESDLETH